MSKMAEIDHRELDDLFERYRRAPGSFVFVPLADACRKLKRIDEALEICDNGLGHHPDYASGHVVKAKCLYDATRSDDARAEFHRVLELDPNNLVALKYLGMIAADAGDLAAARGHFKQILSLDPENKQIRDTLRLIDEQEREAVDESPAETPPVAQDATFEGPSIVLGGDVETSDELATITLAEIFASQGYVSKARKIYEEILKRQPGNNVIREKLDELSDVGSLDPKEVSPEETARGGHSDSVVVETEVGPSESEPGAAEEWEDAFVDTHPDEGGGGADPSAPATEDMRSASKAHQTRKPGRPTRRSIDEEDSLRHFQRWVRNISD